MEGIVIGRAPGRLNPQNLFLLQMRGKTTLGGGTELKPMLLGGFFLHVLAIKPSFIRYTGFYC
jgi:hypothetical protein